MENLDRASVDCPANYPALIRWGMEREQNSLRYKFTCAQVTIPQGVYTHEFTLQASGDQIVYLDRHNVTCPPGYFFHQFKTNAKMWNGERVTRYSVTCLGDLTPECAGYPEASGNPICPDGKMCSGIYNADITGFDFDYLSKGCPDNIPIQSTCKEGEMVLGWYISDYAVFGGENCIKNFKGRVCGTFSCAFNVCAICHHIRPDSSPTFNEPHFVFRTLRGRS